MDDKELLGLAANAARYKYDCKLDVDGLWASIHPGNCYGIWNPLDDNGDAFSLAVKLGLHIDCNVKNSTVFAHNKLGAKGNPCLMIQEPTGKGICRYAATRRAIVRAAATIGAKV